MTSATTGERRPRVGLNRRIRDLSKSQLRRVFEFGQRAGVDILPRHFYSSVPDIRELSRTEHWKEPHSLVGVRGADVDEQLAELQRWCSRESATRLASDDVWALYATLYAALRAYTVGAPVVRRVILEMMAVILLTPILDILSGVLQEHRLTELTAVPFLLILIPPFVSQAGALGGIFSSRVSSKAMCSTHSSSSASGRA